MAQLKAGIAMKACVVRNGRETEIEARELVAGDIVGRSKLGELRQLEGAGFGIDPKHADEKDGGGKGADGAVLGD